MLSRLAYLLLCRSIQLLALLARSEAAKDLEIEALDPLAALRLRHAHGDSRPK